MISRVLITGATGFIGRALCAHLQARGKTFRATVSLADRRKLLPPTADCVTIGRLEQKPDWRLALSDCDTVVHLAGRAHQMTDPPQEDAPYLLANVAPSESLAREAVRCGVRRIVFASTAKVFGEGRDEPYREQDPAQPTDAYSRSKWLAEQRLADIARAGGVELVVLRIPLVYGAGVAGNFAMLIDAVRSGSWMPLGGIRNRRSLIYRGNLLDLIIRCLDHPAARGRTLPVSDGDDVSTPELIRRIARAAGCRANLLPLPPSLLEIAGRLTGRSRQIERLLGSLTLDPTPLKRDLDWSPPFTMETGLLETLTGASADVFSFSHPANETPT